MKFLLLLLVLAAAWLLWRNARLKSGGDEGHGAAAPPARQQDMVQCPVCAVHLPRGDAVAGADGRMYCSAEHRAQAGS